MHDQEKARREEELIFAEGCSNTGRTIEKLRESSSRKQFKRLGKSATAIVWRICESRHKPKEKILLDSTFLSLSLDELS